MDPNTGYNLEGARKLVNAKGGTLTPEYGNDAVKWSKGYTAPTSGYVAPPPTSTYDQNVAALAGAEKTLLDLQAGLGGAADTGEQTLGEALNFTAPDLITDVTTPDRTLSGSEEDAIRRNQLKLFQREINATNDIYDQMIREAQLEGQGRLGSQRAIAARGGILGSDFAGAQKEKVLGYNRDIIGGIQAERIAKISAIQGLARQAAADEIAAKNAARSKGVDDYLYDLSQGQQNRATNLGRIAAAMVEQGITPEDMPDQIAEIAETIGVSPEAILAQYNTTFKAVELASAAAALETRKTEAGIKKDEADVRKIDADIRAGKIKSIGEGTMLYDIETGKTFKNPKTYAPGSSSKLTIASGALTQEAVAGVHQLLDQNRGSDKYTNTQTYLDELSGFVALGGDPKDFIKEYDPDIYINPEDETRSFLKAFMKKTDSQDLFLGSFGGDLIGDTIKEVESGG